MGAGSNNFVRATVLAGLLVGSCVAQTINPNQIRPSATPNQVLTTVSGNTVWSTPTFSGTVTDFLAPAGGWPSWFVPSVATSTSTPTLTITLSAIPNSALAHSATTVNSQTCTLGSTCTIPGTITAFTTTGSSGAATFSGGTLNIPVYSGAGSTLWNAIGNPSGNTSIIMGLTNTLFTWGSATGSGDMFRKTDSASNTGTGILDH